MSTGAACPHCGAVAGGFVSPGVARVIAFADIHCPQCGGVWYEVRATDSPLRRTWTPRAADPVS